MRRVNSEKYSKVDELMRRWVVQTPKMGVNTLILGVNTLAVSTPTETGVNTGEQLLGAVLTQGVSTPC